MPIYSYNTKSGDKLYRVSYRDPNHIQRTKRGFRRRKDAQDYLARMTTYIADNDYIDPNAGKTLVRQFADTWLKGRKNEGTVNVWGEATASPHTPIYYIRNRSSAPSYSPKSDSAMVTPVADRSHDPIRDGLGFGDHLVL